MQTNFQPLRWILLLVFFLSGGCSSENDPTSIPLPLAVGQAYGGGVIFYLDDTGTSGLIAAPFDQGTDVPWFNGTTLVTHATGTGLGAGSENTAAIVATLGSGSYAAFLCDELVLNGFSDWYLPSKDELNALFLQRDAVGGFATGFYWSSTEHGEGSAWEQVFNSGTQYFTNKNFHINVRAVRTFSVR